MKFKDKWNSYSHSFHFQTNDKHQTVEINQNIKSNAEVSLPYWSNLDKVEQYNFLFHYSSPKAHLIYLMNAFKI